MNSFASLNEEIKQRLAKLCFLTKTRPSALFEWNEPEDWWARMQFDLLIMDTLQEKGNG
jgi:hypothetical protein